MQGTLHLPLDPLCLPFSANAACCRICAHCVQSECEVDMNDSALFPLNKLPRGGRLLGNLTLFKLVV